MGIAHKSQQIIHFHPAGQRCHIGDVTHVFQKPCSWLHQVVEYNIGEVWTKVASTPLKVAGHDPVYPRVLNVWGTSDWCVVRRENEWLTEIVNRARPGQGKFVALKNSDHFFLRTESMQESFRYFRAGPEGPFGKFNPLILNTVRDWLDETVAQSR